MHTFTLAAIRKIINGFSLFLAICLAYFENGRCSLFTVHSEQHKKICGKQRKEVNKSPEQIISSWQLVVKSKLMLSHNDEQQKRDCSELRALAHFAYIYIYKF